MTAGALREYLQRWDELKREFGHDGQHLFCHPDILWVPKTLSRCLISAFATSHARSRSRPEPRQHDRSPWPSDSRT